MARTRSTKEIFNFSRGLITEVSPFAFPEDAVSDIDNVEITKLGVAQRRLGLDYESGYTVNTYNSQLSNADEAQVSTYLWKDASGSGEDLWLVWLAGSIYVFDATTGTVGAFIDDLDITTGTVGNQNSQARGRCHFSKLNSDVLITFSNMGTNLHVPKLLSWDSGTDTLSYTSPDTVSVRDIWGVDDTLSVDERPTSLSNAHDYNLRNQGWTNANIVVFQADAANTSGVYPSNADIMHIGRDDTATVPAQPNFTSIYDIIIQHSFGTTPAAKGKHVLSFDNLYGDRNSIVSGTNIGPQGYYTAISRSYAGRMWHAFRSDNTSVSTVANDDVQPDLLKTLCFSKTASGIDRAFQCYTEADPGSEEDSAVVASDGGTIEVPELGKVIEYREFNGTLFVFTDTGIWGINGGDSVFSALNFQVFKVSDVVALHWETIVNTSANVVFWAEDAIYALRYDTEEEAFVVNNLTSTTIKTKYDTIPYDGKFYAKGKYFPSLNQIRWLYATDQDYSSSDNYNHYDKEMIFDLDLVSFTFNSFSEISGSDSAFVVDYLPEYKNGGVKYLTFVTSSADDQHDFTFSTLRDTTFVDYETRGTGQSYDSYLETGAYLEGDSQRSKQIPYVTTHFYITEDGVSGTSPTFTLDNPSGCYIRSKWDFSNDNSAGRWSAQEQVYRFHQVYAIEDASDPFTVGYEILSTKTMLAGKGRAVKLRFDSESGKHFKLIGWGITFSGQSNV